MISKISMVSLILLAITTNSYAVNLQQVYQAAIKNDQILKSALAVKRQAAQASPQALAQLFPTINLTAQAGWQRFHGPNPTMPGNITTRSRFFNYTLDLRQAIFNFAAWSNLRVAKNNVKSAYATYTQAKQDLIARVISAYFKVLEQQEMVNYASAAKRALFKKYQQAKESFHVGIKTITDVYQAKAAYDGAISTYISAKNNLDSAFEALSVITNHHYHQLLPLSNHFPIVKPNPTDIKPWVRATYVHNWQIIAARYRAKAAKEAIETQWGGHLPSVDIEAQYNNQLSHTFGSISQRTITGPLVQLNLTVPIFNGGAITSNVNKAIAYYQQLASALELTRRQQVKVTRQSYLAILAGASQIKADRRTIISDQSALKGTEEGYKVGTQTMLNVLDAQKKLYDDLSQYAANRYQYIKSGIALKKAVGILAKKDIITINSWLSPLVTKPNPFDSNPTMPSKPPLKKHARLNTTAK